MPRAEKHESRIEIDQLEEQWREAVLQDDAATMNTLLAGDYMAITPWGALQTKEETLNSMRSGRWRITVLNLLDRKVRFYGTTAIVNSVAEVQGASPGGNISGSYRYTHVYVRTPQGDWKIVNFEASRIRHPGEHRRRMREQPGRF